MKNIQEIEIPEEMVPDLTVWVNKRYAMGRNFIIRFKSDASCSIIMAEEEIVLKYKVWAFMQGWKAGKENKQD